MTGLRRSSATPPPADAEAAVQRLVAAWKSSKGYTNVGIKELADALDALVQSTRPTQEKE